MIYVSKNKMRNLHKYKRNIKFKIKNLKVVIHICLENMNVDSIKENIGYNLDLLSVEMTSLHLLLTLIFLIKKNKHKKSNYNTGFLFFAINHRGSECFLKDLFDPFSSF